MIKLDSGVHNDQLLLPADFQAEIHVIQRHRQLLVKTPDLFENRPLYHHAGPCNGANILNGNEPAKIPVVNLWTAVHHMSGKPADSHYNSRVLDGIVRVKQLCACRPHILSLTLSKHPGHPVRRNHFHIVVQE